MEIRDTKPARGAAAIRKAEARAGAPSAAAAAGSRDALTLAGLAEAELSPKVRQALFSLLGDVDRLQRELQTARGRIEYLEKLVDEDPLMPVANRRAFVRELTRMMAFAQRYGTRASVVYFDVNDMKRINDAHGHAAGDAALLQVARLLVENVRNTDVVGRLGGDELGVLLVQTDQALAEHKAADLAAHVAAHPLPWQGQSVPLSVAYGVYSFAGGENATDVLDTADRAMYARKRQQKPAS